MHDRIAVNASLAKRSSINPAECQLHAVIGCHHRLGKIIRVAQAFHFKGGSRQSNRSISRATLFKRAVHFDTANLMLDEPIDRQNACLLSGFMEHSLAICNPNETSSAQVDL